MLLTILGGTMVAIGVSGLLDIRKDKNNDKYQIKDLFPLDFTAMKIHKIFKRAEIGVKDDKDWLYPELVRVRMKKGNKVLYYKLALGMSMTQVLQKMNNLCDGMGCEIIPKMIEGDKYVDFKLTILSGHLKNEILFSPDQFDIVNTGGLHIPIGFSRRGIEEIDISSDDNSHILICGQTGSGKSCLLRYILTYLHVKKSPDDIEIWIADLKQGSEREIFGNTKHIIKSISDPYQAEEFFMELLNLAHKRYREIKSLKCVNMEQYNKKSLIKMKRLIVVVDEIGTLEGKNESFQRAVLAAKMCCQIFRACGMNLIISTQKPDPVIDPTFRNHLSVVIGFKVRTNNASGVILGDREDHRLKFIDGELKGRCYLQIDKEIKTQVPYISSEQTEKIMEQYQIQEVYEVAK